MSLGVLTGELIRAGRALCRIDQAELARTAGLSVETVKRLERFRGPVEATTRTVNALVNAFQECGVMFDDQPGMGLGLRFREPPAEQERRRAHG